MATDTCHNCSIDLEPGFDVCWKCGAEVDGGPPPEDFGSEGADEDELQSELGEIRDAAAEAAFNKTVAGQARSARLAGQTLFQIDIPLSRTRGTAIPMLGAFAHSSAPANCSHVVQEIEAEGWRLEHIGYVYRLTGSDSRDKFMMSGQQQAFSGEIVGIYLFRAVA